MSDFPTLGGTFGAGGARVVLDPQKLAEILSSPNGPVARRLIEDGELVKVEAQRRVGVYEPPPEGPTRARRPGTLRDSIVKRFVADARGFAVLVGSEDKIALLHHEGTVPHAIVARLKPLLVFYWRRVGKVVRVLRVNHPGTKPNRYLTEALSVLRGRY